MKRFDGYFSAPKAFADIAENFRIRVPTADDSLPKARIVGDCCYPLLQEGDVVTYDPCLTPQHGDLVSFRWSDAIMAQARANPEKVDARYRSTIDSGNNSVKIFVTPFEHDQPWLLSVDLVSRLADNMISGTICRIERNGKRVGEIQEAGQINPGAATFVSFVNCTATQVFSGAGAIHVSELARIDFNPVSFDTNAQVSITAGYRTGRQNINGFQRIGLRFVTGVTSVYDADVQIPVGGSTTDMQPVTQVGVFSYTANNSAYVLLQWDVASGTNSFTMDQMSIRTEFIKR